MSWSDKEPNNKTCRALCWNKCRPKLTWKMFAGWLSLCVFYVFRVLCLLFIGMAGSWLSVVRLYSCAYRVFVFMQGQSLFHV